MNATAITDQEFAQFQQFIYETAGISMTTGKKALVGGRLARRLRQLNLNNYGDYFHLLTSGNAVAEMQTAVDLLTTNETYFFRESTHFDFLCKHTLSLQQAAQGVRVWSAACSTGEEAYSIAMVLADCLGSGQWEVLGSDISRRVLQHAAIGHYPVERTKHIPKAYLHRFCLKGMGDQQGSLLVERDLRARVQFIQANLNEPLPQLGMFDAIFLRNVMIYFNSETKRQVVKRVVSLLRPGGIFFIGHSESLQGIHDAIRPLVPSIYQKL